ncbi:MAG: aminopeptidase N, partial [Actinomyces sp.]|nr:aminopeptidase N [Actinomyces sp.]
LKASFTFTVTAPSSWTVLSNSPTPDPTPTKASDGSGDAHTFAFAPTEPMSSYVTAIVAGPYVGATDEYVAEDGRTVPLGVYCRKSLVEHMDSEEILDLTKRGFAYYEDLFATPYAFTKYDQIFVPEFNAGAMENAGCVTHRDDYIFRSRPVEARVERRAVTILHELAHMWFGDLVTMKWWNDLWLNESFAEFMSHLALAEATKYTEGWTGFMVRKDWGLKQDQLPTTHPITAEIRDLADVEVNFDGITYAKGASVLRQLVSYVGRDAFFAGLHEYLTKHSYANATLDDLLTELAAASGRDLASWSKVWLEEAGVTLLRPVVTTAEDGTIERLEITQEAFSEGASLRPHRLGVAGYSLTEEGTLAQVFREELDVNGASTVVEAAAGIARPDFILVNDGDLGYAKVRLDEQSLAFAVANITKFTDSLTRGVVMASAWDMTRDGEMPARDYLNLALTSIPVEDNMSLLMLTLRHIDEAVRTFVAPQARPEAAEDTGRRLLLLARTAASGSDTQRMLVAAAARNASSEEQFEAIRGLFDATQTLDGLDLDVDLKWDLLVSLVRGSVATESDIDALEAEDDTMTGHQNAAACRAARAGEWIKADVWDKVLTDTSIPNDTRWAMISGFWAQARTNPSAYAPYVAEYFDALAGIWERFTFHTAEDLTTLLFPTALAGYTTEVDVVASGKAWIDTHADASAGTLRIIRELIDVCERQIANQAVDAG